MRAHTAIAGARPGARLTAAGGAALAILATATACTSPSGAAATGGPATPSGGVTTALGPSSTARLSPSAPSSPSPSATPALITPTPFVSVTATSSPVPIGAPSTGGGGTAGVQDILLFGLGGAALLAGAGSLAYRRRTLRDR
jgi:hypothetical protein